MKSAVNGARSLPKRMSAEEKPPGPLPVEVLHPGLVLRGQGCLPLGDGHLGILVALERAGQLLAPGVPVGNGADKRLRDVLAGRLRLVDDGFELRADRQEDEDAQPHGDRGDPEHVDAVVQQRAGADQDDEDGQRGNGQDRHQVVAHGERPDEDDQDDQLVVPAATEPLPPAEGKPGEERDGEERDRVDLFVDVRLVPDREGGGADERGRGRRR